MEIRALRLFHLVVTRGSLSAAAEVMGMGASAASRMIVLLESETRLRLFNRTRRRLTLTPEGEAFHRASEHILAGFEEIPRIAAEVRARSQQQLRLMTGPRSGQSFVAAAVALFHREHPETRITIDMDTRFAIDGRVGTRLYDLGIVSLPVTHPNIEIDNHPLFRVRMEAVLPVSHRLAAQSVVTAQDLAPEALIGLWPGQRWRQQVDDFYRAGGVRPRYAVETRSSLMACRMVHEGVGVAMLDRLCATAIDLDGLVLRPLAPERWILFGYVHQARHPPGPAALAFLGCLRQFLEAFRATSVENANAVVIM